MTNFSVRKLGDQFFISFRNGIANVASSDINFPESFYRWNSDVTFDLRIDQNARDSLMKVAENYGLDRMLYDPDKFLYPTVLSDAQIIALGQNPFTWKQSYVPVELKISYKDSNNIIQKYSTSNVEARVKGFGSFLPYNRKMPLRIQSSTPIDGFGTTTEVTLNNMIQDGSNITEHIVYKIFRDYGMPAPRTNFIRLFVNDTTIKITSIQNNLITTNGNHYLFEGMRIKFVNLNNISNDSIFYVISSGRTNTTFKISSTLNGSEYALPNLTSVNIEYYTDYGEYLNVENLRNTYRLNELFGTGQTKSIYEINVTTFDKELTIPTTDPYYDRDIGSGDRSDLHNFLTQLGSTSNWYTNISSCTDIDQFIKFTVIELLLSQNDGYNTFLNNSYLHSDINNKFRIIPWGADSYFGTCPLNSNAWTYYSRWAQQCFVNKITMDKFVVELVKFKNWLKNDSNIISYITNIFNQKISDFTSDQKKPNSEDLTSLTTAKNGIINYITNGIDQETNTFLQRPYPVTNLTGQTVGDNFILSWDPVDKNVNGDTINDLTYEIIFLGAQDHKYRWGGWAGSDYSYGMSTSSTTYSLSSSTINSLYSLITNDMDIEGKRELWGGLYLSVVSRRTDDTWGFAAQPILAKARVPDTPSVPYIPSMKVFITEAMSNSNATYGLSSAPDWFEITNFDSSGINISGWRMDDDSNDALQSMPLLPSGWNVLATGESAVFIETNNPSVAIPNFRSFWNLSPSIKIGSYNGSKVGLSSGGDQVNLFVPSGNSSTSFVKLTGVIFGSATTNRSFYWEYNNNIVSLTGLSIPNSRGAYVGSGGSPTVYATGSPGVYSTGICTEVSYSYASCYNIDALYDTIEPWDPTYCESQYSHTKYLSKNNYLFKQSVDPPSGSYDLLCSETYPVSISNKIKITIPDDPIFSGTYVFDYNPGQGDNLLSSINWVLNEAESSHSLVPYNHSDSAFDGKTLISFDDNTNNYNRYNYKGYLELKTRYYNDENNAAARFLENAYAFPADFVLTAVQPPCPCTGIPGVDFVSTIGSGHRLAVGFVHPIRWRHPYKNWILVDRISHTIESAIPDYTTGSPINVGNQSYYSPEQQQTVYLNNSKYVNYAESYVPGTAESVIGDGFIGITLTESWPKCTGVPDLGFAFRSSASGLGIDRGWGLVADQFDIQGLGRHQEYIRDVVNNFDLIIKDERPFYENKTPIKAVIEFVYSCRSGISCSTFDNVTPQTNISVITGLYVGCPTNVNYIGTDYLCGENNQINPPDSYWTQNNITSTEIIYSGYNEKPFFYTDSTSTYRILPVVFTGQASANRIVNIYDYNPSNSNNLISIRTTGGTPTQIREFLRSSLFAHEITTLNSNPSNLTVTNSSYNKWDLYWTVNTGLYTAKVYIIPDIENVPSPTIFITGAGSSSVNGTYYYDSYGRGYNPDNESYGGIFVKDAQSRIALSVSGSNVIHEWRIQKLINNNWVNYYGNNGVYTGIINYTNNLRIGTLNTNWYTNSFCFSGENPAPSSVTYYYR